jgi:hypothetical protein
LTDFQMITTRWQPKWSSIRMTGSSWNWPFENQTCPVFRCLQLQKTIFLLRLICAGNAIFHEFILYSTLKSLGWLLIYFSNDCFFLQMKLKLQQKLSFSPPTFKKSLLKNTL